MMVFDKRCCTNHQAALSSGAGMQQQSSRKEISNREGLNAPCLEANDIRFLLE